jgi:hypothetical protein
MLCPIVYCIQTKTAIEKDGFMWRNMEITPKDLSLMPQSAIIRTERGLAMPSATPAGNAGTRITLFP